MKSFLTTASLLAATFAMAACGSKNNSGAPAAQQRIDSSRYADVTAYTPKGDTAWHLVVANSYKLQMNDYSANVYDDNNHLYRASAGSVVTVRPHVLAKVSAPADGVDVTAYTPKGDVAWHTVVGHCGCGVTMTDYGTKAVDGNGQVFRASAGTTVISRPMNAPKK